MKRKKVRKIKFHVHNEEWFCCNNNITRAEEVKRKSDGVEAEKAIRKDEIEEWENLWGSEEGNKEAVIRWMREGNSIRIKKNKQTKNMLILRVIKISANNPWT